MPLFSGQRHAERLIEYAAVGHEPTGNDGNDIDNDENRQHEDELEGTGRSLNVTTQELSHASKRKAPNYSVVESGKAPSEEANSRTSVPVIQGWPQGPRTLKGVSIPFLIGDTLLILLPIAFLGKYLLQERKVNFVLI